MKNLLLELFATFDADSHEQKLHILAMLEGMTLSRELKRVIRELRPDILKAIDGTTILSLEELV